MTNNEALETALAKLEAQEINFGFLERFNVDENWEATKAIKKQMPMKVIGISRNEDNMHIANCPYCGCLVSDRYHSNNCGRCGQKLDWTEGGMSMTENETINGWTFEETIKTTENLIKAESNMFKWDVLSHLRDFAESYKDELEQYREIGTVEELQELKEKSVAKKPIMRAIEEYEVECFCCPCCNDMLTDRIPLENKTFYFHCLNCGQKLDWQ